MFFIRFYINLAFPLYNSIKEQKPHFNQEQKKMGEEALLPENTSNNIYNLYWKEGNINNIDLSKYYEYYAKDNISKPKKAENKVIFENKNKNSN